MYMSTKLSTQFSCKLSLSNMAFVQGASTSETNFAMAVTKYAKNRGYQANVPNPSNPLCSNTVARASHHKNRAVGRGQTRVCSADSLHHKHTGRRDSHTPVCTKRRQLPDA